MVLDMNSLVADPDTFMKDLEEYLEMSRNSNNPCLFAEAAGKHTPGHVKCAACAKERDMLIAMVRGQGMAKLLCEARQEGNSISLKCQRCDYETKLCRQSRAKKHLTSHWHKHHSDVEYESCEASHLGRDGPEASCDEEQNLHGDTKVDKVSAAVAGAQNGVSPQTVLLAEDVREEEEQVDHQHGGDVGDDTQGDVLPQVALLVGDIREEEDRVDQQLSGEVGDDPQGVVLSQDVLLAGDVREEEEQVDQQHVGDGGDDTQVVVLPQAVLLAGDVRVEEDQVDHQADGGAGDGAHAVIPPQAVLFAGDVRGEEEEVNNQLGGCAGDVATDGLPPQVVLHAGDVSGEKEQVDTQLSGGGANGDAQDALLPRVALPAGDGRVEEKHVTSDVDDSKATVFPHNVLLAGYYNYLGCGTGGGAQDAVCPQVVHLAGDSGGEEERDQFDGVSGNGVLDKLLPQAVLFAGDSGGEEEDGDQDAVHPQVALLAVDSGGEEEQVEEDKFGGWTGAVVQDKVPPHVVLLAGDSKGEENQVNNHLGGGGASEDAQDGVPGQQVLGVRGDVYERGERDPGGDGQAFRHGHGDDDPGGEGHRVLCVRGDAYARGTYDAAQNEVPPAGGAAGDGAQDEGLSPVVVLAGDVEIVRDDCQDDSHVQVVLLAGEDRGGEVHDDQLHVGGGGDHNQCSVHAQGVLLAGDDRGDEAQDDQLHVDGGDYHQCSVHAKVILLEGDDREDGRGEEEEVHSLLGGVARDNPQGAVLAQVSLPAGDERGQEEQADNQPAGCTDADFEYAATAQVSHVVKDTIGGGGGVPHLVNGEDDTRETGKGDQVAVRVDNGVVYHADDPWKTGGADPGEAGVEDHEVLIAKGDGPGAPQVRDDEGGLGMGGEKHVLSDDSGGEVQQVLCAKGDDYEAHRDDGERDPVETGGKDHGNLGVRGEGQVGKPVGGEDHTEETGSKDHGDNSVRGDGRIVHHVDDPWETGGTDYKVLSGRGDSIVIHPGGGDNDSREAGIEGSEVLSAREDCPCVFQAGVKGDPGRAGGEHDLSHEPWETGKEGQQVPWVRGVGHAIDLDGGEENPGEAGESKHEVLGVRGDGRGVQPVGGGDDDDPGEGPQLLDGVAGGDGQCIEGGQRCLCAVDSEGGSVSRPSLVEVSAWDRAHKDPDKDRQEKSAVGMGKLKAQKFSKHVVQHKHKCMKRKRGRKQERRRMQPMKRSKQEKKRKIQAMRRQRQKIEIKQERKKSVQARQRDKQEIKKKRIRILVMWIERRKGGQARRDEPAVLSRGRADSGKRQM